MNTISNGQGLEQSASYSGLNTQSAGNSQLAKNDFLRLLVTQLSNQDPLDPVNNQEFAAQLAQFSSLEQLENMNSSLETSLQQDQLLAGAMQSNMAASLIGRTVVAVDDRIELEDGGASIHWEASRPPAHLAIEVLDSNGVVVRNMQLPDPEDVIHWNGRNDKGERLDDGVYQLRLSATDANGAEITARSLLVDRVDSVRYRDGLSWLVAGTIELSLSQVSELRGDTPEQGGSAPSMTPPDPLSDSDMTLD